MNAADLALLADIYYGRIDDLGELLAASPGAIRLRDAGLIVYRPARRCDVCDDLARDVSGVSAAGIETAACGACRGEPEADRDLAPYGVSDAGYRMLAHEASTLTPGHYADVTPPRGRPWTGVLVERLTSRRRRTDPLEDGWFVAPAPRRADVCVWVPARLLTPAVQG